MRARFKKGDIVYLKRYAPNRHRRFKIAKRRKENDIWYYLVKKEIGFGLGFFSTLIEKFSRMLHNYNLITYKSYINIRFKLKQKPVFDKDIFDIGLRFPFRKDAFLPESLLSGSPEPDKPIICSHNGCELLTSYLNTNVPN